jgi:hypothetical protein
MTDQIELSVTVNGMTYSVRCKLQSTLLASSGPMSIRAAIAPLQRELCDRMVEILDARMEHPRVVIQEVGNDLTPSA